MKLVSPPHVVGASARPSGLVEPDEPSWKTLFCLGKDPLEAPIGYFDRLGDTFQIRLLGVPHVLTRGPAWFDEVLVKKAASFQKDRTTKGLSKLLGQGLLVRDGAAWRERRKLLSPAFVPSAVASLLPIISEETASELDTWRAGQLLDLHQAMARLTMRIALRTLFGYKPQLDEHFERHMAAAMRYFEGVLGTQIPLPTWIPTETNRSFKRARAALVAIVERVIDTPAPTQSVLGALQAARSRGELCHADLVDEAMTMLVAGHETAALSLTYLIAELGLRPDLQEPLAEQVRDWATPSSLTPLTGDGPLHRALLEGLRLYPVAWAVGREAFEPVEILGHCLAPGTQVYLYQWAMQRHEVVYDNARTFEPDRFIDRPLSSLPRGAFAPFGAGPRVCIGNQFALAEVGVIVAEVMRRFRVDTASTYPPRYRASITARPREPVLIRLRPR